MQEPVRELVYAAPAPSLRGRVAWYAGYRETGLAPALHRGLPSPYLTLILTFDDPVELAAHPDPRQPPATYAALLAGLHVTPAMISHPGRQSGVQVALHPLAARSLLGLPAGPSGRSTCPHRTSSVLRSRGCSTGCAPRRPGRAVSPCSIAGS